MQDLILHGPKRANRRLVKSSPERLNPPNVLNRPKRPTGSKYLGITIVPHQHFQFVPGLEFLYWETRVFSFCTGLFHRSHGCIPGYPVQKPFALRMPVHESPPSKNSGPPNNSNDELVNP
eukprot:3111289-Rhodomonas_salina.1